MAVGAKKKSELRYHTDVEEFIPYAAHYDEETIITKNGELLQVIKIEGFGVETDSKISDKESLRDLIRKSISEHIPSDDFAIWIHTIRKQKDLSTGGHYKESFNNKINEEWIKKNNWRSKFINELYITIITNGEKLSIKNPLFFIESLRIKKEFKTREEKLNKSLETLTGITNNIIGDLSEFGARRLSLFKRDGVYYSEVMSFKSKIMNLRQEDIPLSPNELSDVLPTHKVSFKYNMVQVEGATGRHFGAILSIKQYRELSLRFLDKLLTIPANFIISESFDFVDKEIVFEEFKDQKRILDLSGSERIKEVSGINEIFDKTIKDSSTAFGESQITITILEDTVKALQQALSDIVDLLRKTGLSFVREDLFLENCYWSSMPANFDFLRRQTYLPIKRLGGFASLFDFSTGKIDGNKWGRALTALPSRNGMPYFFNFHYDNNGNSFLIGQREKRRKTFLNFLIAETQKLSPNILYLEKESSSKIFVELSGGKYFNSLETLEINPNQKNSFYTANIESGRVSLLNIKLYLEKLIDNETPVILVLDSIEIDATEEEIAEFLKYLPEHNAILVFSGSKEIYLKDNINKNLKNFETKIFMQSTKDLEDEFLKQTDITDKAIETISTLDNEILIRRHNYSQVVKCEASELTLSDIMYAEKDLIKSYNDYLLQNTEATANEWLEKIYPMKT